MDMIKVNLMKDQMSTPSQLITMVGNQLRQQRMPLICR